MENLLQLLASGIGLHTKASKLKRYLIGNTGCSSYLFTADTTFHVKFTAHGDKVFFNELAHQSSFGIICIQLKEPLARREARKLLCSYMEAMQEPLAIAHTLPAEIKKIAGSYTAATTWQDKQNRDWDVKGYCNNHVLAVLYVKDIGRAKVADAEAYLNSFKFAA